MNNAPQNDNHLTQNARNAVKMEIQRKKALGLPIARFDSKTSRVYIEYADGRIEECGYATDNR